MTTIRAVDYLTSLVNELRKLPKETEWVEFKVNDAEPQETGEYLSALSNAAALHGKAFAYLVWGVEDGTHDLVGTSFDPATAKVGNEELENWLLRLLSPRIDFHFHCFETGGKQVVLLEIGQAFRHPVAFQSAEWIRVGSYKKRLKEFPEKEKILWRIFDHTPFERLIAAEGLAADDVLKLLEYPAYFDLLGLPLPDAKEGILRALVDDGMILKADNGTWSITNLGAILLAKKLGTFKGLERKAVRVVTYKGRSRVETLHEQPGTKGYAVGFEGLIAYIISQVPPNEVMGKALRKAVPMYPDLAVRELVANALIHQDFLVTGAGPMVELFEDRLEITNPGKPLVKTERFLDSPPKSRNEALASFMRRVGVCEERGSGVDKVVFQTEYNQLPAPLFEVPEDSTRAVLFAHRALTHMDREDRIRATYLHACLRYVERDFMTNTTLRGRFGIEPQNSAMASRLIKEAIQAGAICPHDPDAAPKMKKYVPFWAKPHPESPT
ncbi:ATP-binding protein [Geothrix oryzisoli]|uniref:ATP-binding protein n=1 Tax=Geothrix oryzisoli TaxID=2922721 RepID=UPI001FAE1650|nr:ATP-binding protein [Geothrix oryzisoli]